MTIDFFKSVSDKFYKWAAEWVMLEDETKSLCDIPIPVIIAKLIYGSIFTMEELRLEMKKHNIPLHESFYNDAQRFLLYEESLNG